MLPVRLLRPDNATLTPMPGFVIDSPYGAVALLQTARPPVVVPVKPRGVLQADVPEAPQVISCGLEVADSSTKYASADFGRKSFTATGSDPVPVVCSLRETRASALMYGTEVKARKYHGNEVSVIFTSIIWA